MNQRWLWWLCLAVLGLSGCQLEDEGSSHPEGAEFAELGTPAVDPGPLEMPDSSAQVPAGVDAPEGWMGQVQASLAASERQPAWQDEGVVLTHRGENLRGTLSDDGALQVVRRSSGGPLASGALDITLHTSHWGRSGRTIAAIRWMV